MDDSIEQRAQDIWDRRTKKDVARIIKQYEFTGGGDLLWLDWEMLPGNFQDHIRDMAQKQIEYRRTVRKTTDKADYIIDLLRELNKHRPIPGSGAIDYNAITINDDGDLVILVVIGDAIWLYTTTPNDLSDDPAETAERLAKKFTPERWTGEDEVIIGFKR